MGSKHQIDGDVIWKQIHHHSFVSLPFETKGDMYPFILEILNLRHPDVILETAIVDSTVRINIYSSDMQNVEKIKSDVERIYRY